MKSTIVTYNEIWKRIRGQCPTNNTGQNPAMTGLVRTWALMVDKGILTMDEVIYCALAECRDGDAP